MLNAFIPFSRHFEPARKINEGGWKFEIFTFTKSFWHLNTRRHPSQRKKFCKGNWELIKNSYFETLFFESFAMVKFRRRQKFAESRDDDNVWTPLKISCKVGKGNEEILILEAFRFHLIKRSFCSQFSEDTTKNKIQYFVEKKFERNNSLQKILELTLGLLLPRRR